MGVKAWITVNGQHIPIMDGESKMAAVGRFIKSKTKGVLKNRDKDFFKSVKQHQKENKNSKEDYKKSDSYNYWRANQDMEVKYGPNWDKQSKHWIRRIDKDAVRKSYFPNGRQFKDISSGELITIQKYGKDKTTVSIKDINGKIRTKDVDTKKLYNDYKFYDAARLNMPRNMNETATRYRLKEDKPKRAAKGELTEKKLYLDYKNNYSTDELKAYKSQLDNHYKQFKNSNKYGDDITARNYRAITTVLAERRKRK